MIVSQPSQWLISLTRIKSTEIQLHMLKLNADMIILTKFNNIWYRHLYFQQNWLFWVKIWCTEEISTSAACPHDGSSCVPYNTVTVCTPWLPRFNGGSTVMKWLSLWAFGLGDNQCFMLVLCAYLQMGLQQEQLLLGRAAWDRMSSSVSVVQEAPLGQWSVEQWRQLQKGHKTSAIGLDNLSQWSSSVCMGNLIDDTLTNARAKDNTVYAKESIAGEERHQTSGHSSNK